MEVAKADISFEAGYPQLEFGLFQETSAMLQHLFKRLEPHGLRLTDVRFEHSSTNIGEQYIQCYLFNYWMTIRIRIDRIEVICSELPRDYVDKFKAAILDVLGAVKDYRPELSFRAFAVAVGLHAKLEGQPARDYLARFVSIIPRNLGPSTGSGVVFYFGPEGNRLLSSITVDASAVVKDAVYLRIHGVWDAKQVSPNSVSEITDRFLRQALESLGLYLPS
jgi:hypothetical protein